MLGLKELTTIAIRQFQAPFDCRRINRSETPRSLASQRKPCLPYPVLDQTKPQAPVWRENFEKPVGKKRARCGEGGRHGLRKDCLTRRVPWLNSFGLLIQRRIRHPETRSQNANQVGKVEVMQD